MQHAFLRISLAIICLAANSSSLKGVTVATPTFAPAEGSSATQLPVAVTCTTSGATIHYTLTGVEPTIYDPVVTSGATLTFRRTLALKAKAWVGTDLSPTASAGFDITGDIAAGPQHVLALKSNRQVFAWGSQQYGRLANGSTSSTVNLTSPGAFCYSFGNPVADAIAIATGYNQNVILKYNGTSRSPWCVGYGGVGELGNNDNANSIYPVRVVKSTSKLNGSTTFNDWLPDCTAVAAGQFYSGALGADKLVYTWGGNSGNGRLGNGNTTGTRYYAGTVLTAAGTNLTNISAIEFGDSQALALDSNRKVWGWGSNSNGQLGNGSATGNQPYAGSVLASGTRSASPVDLTDVIDVSTGDLHSAVVRLSATEPGTVWTFGSKANGRLGDGTTSGNTGTPTKVKTNSTTYLSNIVQVSAGPQHTLALDTSKQVWAWGYNAKGALGNNTTSDNPYASRVLAPANSTDTYLSNIVRISTGGIGVYSYSIAVAADGTVYAWGANDSGQLANGTSSTSAIVKLPVAIGSFKVLPNSPDVTLANTVTQSASPGVATLTASPTDTDGVGNIQKVEFYSQGTLVGTKTASPWTQSLTALAAGTYYNYAVVTDNDGNTGYSQPSSFTIVPGDTDSDGLPDAWEMTWFGNLAQNGSGDPDNDRVTNAQEYALNTNPTSAADTDSDGLADDWERFWFNGLTSQSGITDYDGDGLTNAWEYTNRTNPNTSAAARDADADGLPDDWERFYFGDTVPPATGDFDSDGLTNLWEYQHLTNANTSTGNRDSDGDGLPDDWEILYFNDLTKTATADSDGDKISNAKELAQGTNPNTQLANRDADADGLPDDWEKYYFNSPSQTGASDFDSDGLTNKWEFDNDTNPTTLVNERDVDADGLPDDWERFWFTSITLYNGNQDPDADHLSNSQEFSILSNPMTPALEKDTDTDGLADDWERYYFGNLAQNGAGDPDTDKVSNLQEFTITTHPNSYTDTDADGLPDDWERCYFGNLAQVGGGDPDADKVTSLQEFNQNTNPSLAADTDTDGLPDDWEMQRFGSFDENSEGDLDADKVTNLQEFTQNTNPNSYADTDADGLPDDWEMLYFGNLTQTATGDPDADKVSTLQEFTQGTHPNSAADTDTDGLPDDWEKRHFGNLTQAADGDPDVDKANNLLEFTAGTNPNSTADSDSDGLPDDWEICYFGNLAQDSSVDTDGDKITNAQEFSDGSNPNSAMDTDTDGLPDDWERHYFGNLSQTATADPDLDRLYNVQEFIAGTNPTQANPFTDSDQDGLPDDWETAHFGNLAQTAAGDFDLDGLTNFQEWLNCTSPIDADSDDDTVNDGPEVTQGSDPGDPGDGGNPPIDEIQEVNFKAYGDYASWRMEIRGDGPRDHRTLFVVTPAVGVPETGTIKLRRNNKYKVTLHATGSKAGEQETWYCWEARVEDKPAQQTFNNYEANRIPGVAEFFTIGDGHWLVDNRDGLLTTHNHRTENRGGNATTGLEATLLPLELISDLNNDGQISATDNPLRDAALASGTTDEIKDKGTEFIFHNDTLSNGIWDKEDSDPDRPANAKDDDDAEEIVIKPGITEGEVWLDHPAIEGLSFYKSRECNPADKVNLSSSNKFIVSATNPFPDKLYMRADGNNLTYPSANRQLAGDLVLKIKADNSAQVIEALKMKLAVVKELGAEKFFVAARDYIFENNTRLLVKDRKYSASVFRICIICEELSILSPIETYHDDPTPDPERKGPRGIMDAMVEYSEMTIITNGNMVYFSGGDTKWDALALLLLGAETSMTDKCQGGIVTRKHTRLNPASTEAGLVLVAGEGDLAKNDAKFIAQKSDGSFLFDKGHLPKDPLPVAAMGGLSTYYDNPDRNGADRQFVGYWPRTDSGALKGCIFTATHISGNSNVSDFIDDARNSEVPAFEDTRLKLFMLDSGDAAVALAHSGPDEKLKLADFQRANILRIQASYQAGLPYFTNTFLAFKTTKPR